MPDRRRLHKCRRLLLVEDDPNDIFVFRAAAGGLPWVGEVVVAESAEDALDTLETLRRLPPPDRPGVIVLDINLPGTNGLELLPQIRAIKEYRLTPIIMFSSSENESDIETALTSGANAYVEKLFSYPVQMELIQTMLTFWCRYAVHLPA